MKRRYELTEDADADINVLWLYIAQNRSSDTADRLADRIYNALELGIMSRGSAHARRTDQAAAPLAAPSDLGRLPPAPRLPRSSRQHCFPLRFEA